MTATIKPAPPPKPSHLSSAFTGTLSSDALRMYIRQQSMHNTMNKQRCSSATDTVTMHTGRSMLSASEDSEEEEENDDDEEGEDDDDLKWGTAKVSQTSQHPQQQRHQQQHTPTKAPYCTLADLFVQDNEQVDGPVTKSNLTIKPAKVISRRLSELNDDVGISTATIRLSNANAESSSSLTLDHLRQIQAEAESQGSSPLGTERSRQPSILSRLSMFSMDEDEVEESESGHPSSMQTPKKKWMRIRDGSAFEHAGPSPSKIRSPVKMPVHDTLSTPQKSNVKATKAQEFLGPNLRLVVGSPPLRPTSFGKDLSEDCQELANVTPEVRPVAMLHSNSSIDRPSRPARALYAFGGEAAYNELSLAPGQTFEVLEEDVGGGWSSAILKIGEDHRRGLVPRGWYTYIQDFSRSPTLSAAGTENVPKDSAEVPATQLERTNVSGFLSPSSATSNMSRSNSTSGILSPANARDQQSRWDRSRPASGIGQLYSGITEAGAAVQALTQMQRTSSNSSYFAHKSGSKLLAAPAIVESELEDDKGNVSKSSEESESCLASTRATTPATEGLVADVASPKAQPLFASAWKRPGLFGGRSLNRFSPFVTSGAEGFLLFGKAEENSNLNNSEEEQSKLEIVSGSHGGPSWKHPGLVIFVEVHSPEVQADHQGREYTAYAIHTSYVLLQTEGDGEWEEVSSDISMMDRHRRPEEPSLTTSVYRRFNQFKWLYTYFLTNYPALMLSVPPFPSAGYGTGKSARFESGFVERRRRQLQTWLLQVARHPLLCTDAALRFFLDGEEEGEEWLSAAHAIESQEVKGSDAASSLYAKTFHPLFNVDLAESSLESKRMIKFCDSYQRGMSTPETGLLATFRSARNSTSATSDSYRQLSYALLRVITGSAQTVASKATGNVGHSAFASFDYQAYLPPMGNVGRRDANGATNEERAWCWREGCQECKRLTRSLQATAEALQTVADVYDFHANASLYELHDRLTNMSKLNTLHSSLMDVHSSTLAKYLEATGESDLHKEDAENASLNKLDSPPSASIPTAVTDEQLASRCESVVNVTMSEMDRMHVERVQDWNSLSNQFLDSQIEFYEDILATLRRAKEQSSKHQQHISQVFSSDGPILPSPYESHLSAPLRASPLLQPDAGHSSATYFGIWK